MRNAAVRAVTVAAGVCLAVGGAAAAASPAMASEGKDAAKCGSSHKGWGHGSCGGYYSNHWGYDYDYDYNGYNGYHGHDYDDGDFTYIDASDDDVLDLDILDIL